jgi:hypothetical protein
MAREGKAAGRTWRPLAPAPLQSCQPAAERAAHQPPPSPHLPGPPLLLPQEPWLPGGAPDCNKCKRVVLACQQDLQAAATIVQPPPPYTHRPRNLNDTCKAHTTRTRIYGVHGPVEGGGMRAGWMCAGCGQQHARACKGLWHEPVGQYMRPPPSQALMWSWMLMQLLPLPAWTHVHSCSRRLQPSCLAVPSLPLMTLFHLFEPPPLLLLERDLSLWLAGASV